MIIKKAGSGPGFTIHDLKLYVQSMPIITKVVMISNPVHGEVYSIQHYVIKFVSDLRQVGGFLRVSGLLHQ
jgi:hypothetical protein